MTPVKILNLVENKHLGIEYALYKNHMGVFGVRTKDLEVNEVVGIKFFTELKQAQIYFNKCILVA